MSEQEQAEPHGECRYEIQRLQREIADWQAGAISSLLDEAGIPDAGSTVTRVAMLVAQRDEALGIIKGAPA